MAFKVLIEQLPDQIIATFSGSMTEAIYMPEWPEHNQETTVIIDLENLTAINSLGVSKLISWLKEIRTKSLFFRNCPPFYIYQVNMIPDMIPDFAIIDSCYVIYYNGESGKEKRVHFRRGVHYVRWSEKNIQIEEPTQGEGKIEQGFVIDVEPRSFFKFASKYA